jgi:hypothetical protein
VPRLVGPPASAREGFGRCVLLGRSAPARFSDLQTYDELRRAVGYLRWCDDDADVIAPCRSGRAGSHRRATTKSRSVAYPPLVGPPICRAIGGTALSVTSRPTLVSYPALVSAFLEPAGTRDVLDPLCVPATAGCYLDDPRPAGGPTR